MISGPTRSKILLEYISECPLEPEHFNNITSIDPDKINHLPQKVIELVKDPDSRE